MSGIGHNGAPGPTPLEVCTIHVLDLFDQAKEILDGGDVPEELGAKLLDEARKARKAADDQRVVEKAPHDAAAKAVQDAWKPLIDKCVLIETACKAAATKLLLAKEAEQRAEAERLRVEAGQRQQEAQEALRAAPSTDLAARERAEGLLKEAGLAAKAADKADKAKAHAVGGSRAIGLRTYYRAELTDAALALRHYRETQPEALKEWLTEQAQRDVNAGARSIPGIILIEERRAA